MLKMARINNTSVDVVNKIPIMVDEQNKIDQTYKYTILKNGAYYVHYAWDKNQKVRENMVATLPRYVHEGCGFKLFMQTFI